MNPCLPTSGFVILLAGCSLIVPGPDDYTYGFEDAGATDASTDTGAGLDGGSDAGRVDAAVRDGGEGSVDFTIGCATPPDIGQQGDVVRVSFTVGNIGSAMGGPTTVALQMERPAMTSGEMDTFLEMGTERIPLPISALGMAMGEVSFVAPMWTLGGANRLRCVVDSDDEVIEGDETNNTDGSMFIATGLPDLTPVSFRVTRRGTTPPFDFDYFFVVRNDGVTSARTVSWALSPNPSGFPTERGVIPYLGPGDPVVVMGTVSGEEPIQYGASVDTDGSIPESDETNNMALFP